jgi:type VI protein secretion system component VasK
MSDQNPRLAVVDEKAEVSPEAAPGTAAGRKGRSPLFWVLAGALLLCALGWLFQVRENRELAASLEATRTALGRAQAELRAYDLHLSEVGDRVGVLQEQLDSLQALVEEGPRHSQEP